MVIENSINIMATSSSSSRTDSPEATCKGKKETGVLKSKKGLPKSTLKSADSSESIKENKVPSKSSGGGGKKKTVEEIYQKKSQLEHILLRPDTYIGSVEAITTPMWIYEEERLVHRPVTFVPGLYKIFDEIIVNAADNKIRDPSMSNIKVTLDRENNLISVYNDGHGIPIEVHREEGVYVPELIFGHLLTSSNYDDDEKKVTGGRNGYGAKLCNIFSTEFIIETADGFSKFKQMFNNNMTKKKAPVISPNPKGDEYTKITFQPDLAKFGMTHIDDDLVALIKKRVYDLAGCVRGVNVYLNNVRLKVKDFKSYVEMFMESVAQSNAKEGSGAVSKPPLIYECFSDRWEVAATISDGQFQQVSYVNSICTMKGGTHVNHVADQMVNALVDAVKKKDKKGAPIKAFQAKNHLWVFVNCLIENPAFDSQTKENMTLRPTAFGSKCSLSEEFQKKLLKSGIVESILSFAKFKQDQALKKSDGTKTSRISGIAKLDDANNAGTRNASKCTLILTEGDSAKSLAVSGLSVVGRDNFGVFPLRGKLLNVREATHSQIMANAEINAIKQILGLQHGKSYEDASSLRYGHLMIMTDQDHDGSHIKGLIINFLDHFWPSLLKVSGFLLEFITPIVKVTIGKHKTRKEISFFTLPEYEEWKKENDEGKGWNIKYYKGLGTSTTEDAKKYFSNMDLHRKAFQSCSSEDKALIDMAFNKKKADDRKEWLRQCKPGTFMDNSIDEISISDFVNKELILFSMADNARSIPNVVDGLKPGQRKILFACFKRNLKNEIKVAQLAGYVAEHSAYHHGEQSLCSTIVNLAQNFVGSNNLNLLEPIGQFGTRLQGGKDAASARYIFTSLSKLARSVFPSADDALLKYLNDDGQSIEPEWYIPTLPLVLVNGSEGIGTGWSSFVPNYNPREVVINLMRLMDGAEIEKMHPWYRGFKGEIELIAPDKYKISGFLNKLDDNRIQVTELPIRLWTQTYKEMLEEALASSDKSPAWIKDYKEYHTDSTVHFVITLTDDQMAKAEAEGLEKKFKISTTISTSNMVCFDSENRIRKYDNVETILSEFYSLRLKYYQLRKEYLLDQLTMEWTKLDNKVRFVQEIIQGKTIVQNKKKMDLVSELKMKGYAPMNNTKKTSDDPQNGEYGDSDSNTTSSGGYDYLLSMPIWNLTYEKVEQLMKEREEKSQQVKYLTSQTPKDLWRTDLESFLLQWDMFEKDMEELESKTIIAKPSKKGGAKPKPKKTIKSIMLSDDEDIDFDDDDSGDEYGGPKKKRSQEKRPNSSSSTTSSGNLKKEKVKTEKSRTQSNTSVDTSLTTSSLSKGSKDDVIMKEEKKPVVATTKLEDTISARLNSLTSKLDGLFGQVSSSNKKPNATVAKSFSTSTESKESSVEPTEIKKKKASASKSVSAGAKNQMSLTQFIPKKRTTASDDDDYNYQPAQKKMTTTNVTIAASKKINSVLISSDDDDKDDCVVANNSNSLAKSSTKITKKSLYVLSSDSENDAEFSPGVKKKKNASATNSSKCKKQATKAKAPPSKVTSLSTTPASKKIATAVVDSEDSFDDVVDKQATVYAPTPKSRAPARATSRKVTSKKFYDDDDDESFGEDDSGSAFDNDDDDSDF